MTQQMDPSLSQRPLVCPVGEIPPTDVVTTLNQRQ